MATSTNTIKTRVQLKSDTEANWKKSVLTTDHPDGQKTSGTSFVPLLGELIVFTSDDAHPFSRLKVGNGSSNVLALPFIDAGTINGELLPENEIATYSQRSAFPSPGVPNRLYIDLQTKIIYCYTDFGGYTQLSNWTYTTSKTTVTQVTNWSTGTPTTLTARDGILIAKTGILPTLNYYDKNVVSGITRSEA